MCHQAGNDGKQGPELHFSDRLKRRSGLIGSNRCRSEGDRNGVTCFFFLPHADYRVPLMFFLTGSERLVYDSTSLGMFSKDEATELIPKRGKLGGGLRSCLSVTHAGSARRRKIPHVAEHIILDVG
jgi:hypothetical protein